MFSLNWIREHNSKLFDYLTWQTNPWPAQAAHSRLLNIGCGPHPLEHFVNIDFVPDNDKTLGWNLLHIWPDQLSNDIDAAFSEDVFEHFYYGEQVYLLCEMNRALADGGIFRVLMPGIEQLIHYSQGFDSYNPDNDWMRNQFGIQTGSDALNLGMRFSGHRWLHSPSSMNKLAELCGFKAIPTTCDTSTNPKLSGINLRNEVSALSFATDFQKAGRITKWNLFPSDIVNARHLEHVAEGIDLYQSSSGDPQLHYQFPTKISFDQVVAMNFRGGNLSEFYEHSYAKLYLLPDENFAIYSDSTLRSAPYMNVYTQHDIATKKLSKELCVDTIRFDPDERLGNFFYVGPLEVYIREHSC